ncbi:unnamed protein product [Fasciola hepatica]|uniref:Protein lin-52 homolog n=1 Tax=Fasciola hepatica TaxID=6192 RepID=A0ABC9HIU5_FASHE
MWTRAGLLMEEKPEQALLCQDNLDRASPDLWPEQRVSEFMSRLGIDTCLSTQQLMDKIKHLQNLAYEVGLEEEMTRGKFLNILGKR